ncbi:MAG: flagellar hook-length control protein FliK [Rhodomicrobiaceae bacterium]
MSVSLTHVQAALQNHLTNGGSGPLTLNVLHKTESLVQQLQALNQGKPLSVEVLKSLPNGRAEVLTNGLKLDVKASLPLKTGEVLQLKVEQHGSALRLVQPLGDGTNSKSSLPASQQVNSTNAGRATLQNGTPVAGAQNTAAVNSSLLNSSSSTLAGQVAQGQSQAGQVQAKLSNGQPLAQQGLTPQAQGGQALNSQQPNSAFHSSNLVNSTGGLNSNTSGSPGTQLPPQSQVQNQALVTSQAPKPGQVQAQITASALIGVVADTLPGLAKKLGGRSQNQAQTQAHIQGHEKTAGRSSLQSSLPHAGVSSLQNQKLAEDVSAKYKNMSSLAVEEVQEVQQKPLTKPLELNLELPIQGAEKPVFVNLQITPEREDGEGAEERNSFGVKFSIETDDTGPVHASLGLVGKQVRVTLWAERREFAESLNLYRETLDDRLAATGLDVASLQIRRGQPETNLSKTLDHVDAQI